MQNQKEYFFDDANEVYKYKIEPSNDWLKCAKMQNFKSHNKYTPQPDNLYQDFKNNDFSPLVTTILGKK